MVGIHQVGFDGAATEREIAGRTRYMIARSLNIGRMVAFVGSGVSAAYGYKNWGRFTANLVEFTKAKLDDGLVHLDPDTCALLKTYDFDREGANASVSRADRNLLMLEICSEAFEHASHALRAEYEARIVKEVRHSSGAALEDGPGDPLRIIIERLGLRRFLTTNYDPEIENALARTLGCPLGPLGIDEHGRWSRSPSVLRDGNSEAVGPAALSLQFDPTNAEQLVQFAVAAPGHRIGVFHLHGKSIDRASMVITERDYQRIYLQDDPPHRSYRQALNLAFLSNPVLFIGIGMEEPDLLRPLREFVSERDRNAQERPLFALLPSKGSDVDNAEFRRFLYSRYGVKAVFYPVAVGSERATSAEMTAALCDALKGLDHDWREWWQTWRRKPRVRPASFFQETNTVGHDIMVHHETQTKELNFFQDDGDYDEVVAAVEDSRFVVVLGRPGTGKGSLGIKLVRDETLLPENQRRFFASAHFTNEFLSIVHGATRFLADGSASESARNVAATRRPLDRFRHALLHKPALVVIGGLERVLVPANLDNADREGNASERREHVPAIIDAGFPLPLGDPVSREVERILEELVCLQDADSETRVVLTSAVWPHMLGEAAKTEKIKIVRLSGVSKEHLADHSEFTSSAQGVAEADRKELVRRLHSCLKGHAYALAVVGRALENIEDEDSATAWLRSVVARLTASDPQRRPELVIDSAMRELGTDSQSSVRFAGILQRVAMFTTPVDRRAIMSTYESAEEGAIKTAIETLIGNKLLMNVKGFRGGFDRLTAHTVVRKRVLNMLGNLADVPGEPQQFQMADFSGNAAEVLPNNPQAHRFATTCADRLLAAAEETTPGTESGSDPGTRTRAAGARPVWETRRELLRAAYGLIRCCWTSTEIGRQSNLPRELTQTLQRSHYDAYQRRLARLLNAVRRAQSPSEVLEAEWDSPDDVGIEDERATFYVDELAWIYNEMGLVAYCQGTLHDAYALFRAGQDVHDFAEGGSREHRRCQSELNLARVQIERARLNAARSHLRYVSRVSKRIGDEEMRSRALGYMGLVDHLSGDYRSARESYTAAIRSLRDRGNRRGVSIFLRHRGDLWRLRGRIKDAERDISASIAAADAGRHLDLVHYARVAQTHLRIRQGEHSAAAELLVPAFDFARRVGIPKLEADVRGVQAILALNRGELELSSRLTMLSLGIASATGMRLRLTGYLTFLGVLASARGDSQAARHILEAAVELADRQRYQLQLEKANSELMRIRR